MTTTGNQAKIQAISALAQQMFGEGEQLQQFVLRLTAEVFSRKEESKNKPKKPTGEAKSTNSKKISKTITGGCQCDAYIFAVVKNEETGEFEPKQCPRAKDDGSLFCKKHGSIHGKRDDAASNYHGKDVFYEFKWQLHGSVEAGPTFVFEKFRDQLLAKYNQQNGTSDESGNDSEDSASKKKNTKIAASKKEKTEKLPVKKEKTEKPAKKVKTAVSKRSKNPYFEYLSAERENIKAELIAKNSELKGRDLVTSITKEAGRRWKEMSEEERQPYIEVASINDTIQVGDSQITETISSGDQVVSSNSHSSIQQKEESPCCDDHDSSVEQEDEENDRIFNETHKIWVDIETQLYYEAEKSETPLGQIIRSKMVPFKTRKTQ